MPAKKVQIGSEKFIDSYYLPSVNGSVPKAHELALYDAYNETLSQHADDARLDVPLVVIEKLVSAALGKQIAQARMTVSPSFVPAMLKNESDLKLVNKFIESGNGAFEVSAFTRLGQDDMFFSKIGNAVARVIRESVAAHEMSAPQSQFKVVNIVDTHPAVSMKPGSAIVTTKSTVARLVSQSGQIDVVSRQTGYVDLSEFDDQKMRTSLSIMARAYDMGLSEGYGNLIEEARSRIATLFFNPEDHVVRPALASVYLKHVSDETPDESQPGSLR